MQNIFRSNVLAQESMAKLDVEMKKSDDLLSQMMPKSVAEKIKVATSSSLTKKKLFFVQNGASAVETCEVFEMVTIVFNDIPVFGWLAICQDTSPFYSLRNMKLSGTSASSATACRLWRPWTRCLACLTFSLTRITSTRQDIYLWCKKKNCILKVETVKDCFVGVAGAPEK